MNQQTFTYREGIDRAFYVYSTCRDCLRTVLDYFPQGFNELRYDESPGVECGDCGTMTAFFTSPLLATAN